MKNHTAQSAARALRGIHIYSESSRPDLLRACTGAISMSPSDLSRASQACLPAVAQPGLPAQSESQGAAAGASPSESALALRPALELLLGTGLLSPSQQAPSHVSTLTQQWTPIRTAVFLDSLPFSQQRNVNSPGERRGTLLGVGGPLFKKRKLPSFFPLTVFSRREGTGRLS